MPADEQISTTVQAITGAPSWDQRVTLLRQVPDAYGKAQHARVYASIAEAFYVPQLVPDFAYVHWRDEYELQVIEAAYEHAHRLTNGFTRVGIENLAATIREQPATVRIFRLILGLTTQELAASTAFVAESVEGGGPLSNGVIKGLEAGRAAKKAVPEIVAAVIDAAMQGELFAGPHGDVRSKLDKPDTAEGWETVHQYAVEGVPLPVLLHQRHYGGAFRQLLDATSIKRGNLLEDAVEERFADAGVPFIRTGPNTHERIAQEFGVTVRPAPDFVVYDERRVVRAILECKHANDGGTARDKASRFQALRGEGTRLGGVPVFAVLSGLGWRRTADALGPVVRDTDGRVFTGKTLEQLLNVDPFPRLRNSGDAS
jgi:hypothetical protein